MIDDIVDRLLDMEGEYADAEIREEAAAYIKDLREQINTCRELRKYDRIEIERLRWIIGNGK